MSSYLTRFAIGAFAIGCALATQAPQLLAGTVSTSLSKSNASCNQATAAGSTTTCNSLGLSGGFHVIGNLRGVIQGYQNASTPYANCKASTIGSTVTSTCTTATGGAPELPGRVCRGSLLVPACQGWDGVDQSQRRLHRSRHPAHGVERGLDTNRERRGFVYLHRERRLHALSVRVFIASTTASHL